MNGVLLVFLQLNLLLIAACVQHHFRCFWITVSLDIKSTPLKYKKDVRNVCLKDNINKIYLPEDNSLCYENAQKCS